MTVTLADIRRAARILHGNVIRTPLVFSARLSQLTGAQISVKCENFQATNSFKDRGGYNKLANLTPDERQRGVITMSAGNHAQAVAYHAARLGLKATVVMPETTPFTKVEATRGYGAEVILSGDTLADSQITAQQLVQTRGLSLVHPYDDDFVIAGQGTIALEMLEDEPELDAIIVPIGGGGLISGCAIAAKAMKPEIEIIGVEVEAYASMSSALQGKTAPCGGATLAEGIAVKNVVPRTISVCRNLVDDIVVVTEKHIEQAINAYMCRQRSVAEGAGAAGLAAVMADPVRFRERRLGLVLCGGNIDSRILSWVIYRALERDRRIITLRVKIDDRPGILGLIATLLGREGANILEVFHKRMYLDLPLKEAALEFLLETRGADHAEHIVRAIAAQGFVTRIFETPGS